MCKDVPASENGIQWVQTEKERCWRILTPGGSVRCKDQLYQVGRVFIQERRGSQSRLGFYTGEDIDMETARWEKGKGG